MSHGLRNGLIQGLKLSIAGGLVYWMVSSGKLDFKELGILLTDGRMLAGIIGVWILGPCILGACRWKLLLDGVGYHISFRRAVSLQMTGFFFNSAMPGSVGGDLVKVLYVIRDNKEKGKTPAMMSVALDRILGMFGLFTIGGLIIALNFSGVWAITELRPLVVFTLVFLASLVVFFALVFAPFQPPQWLQRLADRPFPGRSAILGIVAAVQNYREAKSALVKAWLLSITVQSLFFCLFYFLSLRLAEGVVVFKDLASILPIGFLATALPLAPGGLGVGHVAFDKLFQMIGLVGGANVFNAFILSQMALNLLGVIPYLTLKKKEPLAPSKPVTRDSAPDPSALPPLRDASP